MSKWFPEGQNGLIQMFTLTRVLRLVPVDQFRRQGPVVEAFRYRGYWFLRFKNGRISIPLDQNTYMDSSRPEELLEVGLINQTHFDEIMAEKAVIRARKERNDRLGCQAEIVDRARINMMRPVRDRIDEIQKQIDQDLCSLKAAELLAFQDEAKKLEKDIERIRKMPTKRLLSAEELERYNAC